jgi:asparagine synthase (glutamine-hydrolysing)
MCGIAGWAGPSMAGPEVLARMCDELAHRGPDGDGAHIEEGRVALGFRRLAVIDLETGDQPLFTEDRNVAVTCNGEIYNYLELGDDLRKRGHTLASHSDSEVIAHLYEDLGLEFVHELHGMFAIALWDSRRQRLVLARDRLGVKPLYYCERDGSLAYASEPQALLRGGWTERRADPQALLEYMTLQYVPPPRSGFVGIHKLHPGSILIWENGRAREVRYWEPPVPPDPLTADPERSLDELDEILREATRVRLRSDVPLGAFLSGGVDSSVVVSYMAELGGTTRTFSIDFPHAGFSESAHAKRVAELYSTEHQELMLEAEMVPAILEAVPKMGEPFADSSALPTYLLSELTKREVTVALSGDGGDEAFSGYRRYGFSAGWARFRPLPNLSVGALRVADPYLRRRGVGRFKRRARYAGHLASYQRMMSHFIPEELRWVATPSFLSSTGAPEQVYRGHLSMPPVSGVRAFSALDTVSYLPGDLLPKVDRMSMAHALEVRSPMLDHRVHELAAGLPNRLRWRGIEGKVLLKDLASRRGLPADLVHRKKQGFGVPLGSWLRGDLRDWITDTLDSETVARRGIVRPKAVQQMLREHLNHEDDHTTRLWNLAAMELWFRAHID